MATVILELLLFLGIMLLLGILFTLEQFTVKRRKRNNNIDGLKPANSFNLFPNVVSFLIFKLTDFLS
jgi:hypothetical protein